MINRVVQEGERLWLVILDQEEDADGLRKTSVTMAVYLHSHPFGYHDVLCAEHKEGRFPITVSLSFLFERNQWQAAVEMSNLINTPRRK